MKRKPDEVLRAAPAGGAQTPAAAKTTDGDASAGDLPNWSRLLTRKQVEARLNVSRWTLLRLQRRDPSFPPFFKLLDSDRLAEHDLEAWIRAQRLSAYDLRATNCPAPPPKPRRPHAPGRR